MKREFVDRSGTDATSVAEFLAEIELLARRLSAGAFELLVMIGQADEAGVWASTGALSCAAWLAELCEIELSTARSQIRVARAMRDFPDLFEAMESREISYSKARILVAYLNAENCPELLELAASTPLRSLSVAIARWSCRNEDDETIGERQYGARSVSWRTDPDGMITITARLEPIVGAGICALIDKLVLTTNAPVGASLRQQRADAFNVIATRPESRQPKPGPMPKSASEPTDVPTSDSGSPELASEGPRSGCAARGGHGPGPELTSEATADSPVTAEIVIHVRGDMNTLADGTPIGDHVVARLLPLSFVSLLVHDMERRPIDASPRRRFLTRRQRRVIDERDRECRHTGCHVTKFLQYDHILPYASDGPTTLENIQRLCGPHNRAKNAKPGD